MSTRIINLRGEKEYISLPKPIWRGRRRYRYSRNSWIEALYSGTRTLRHIILSKADFVQNGKRHKVKKYIEVNNELWNNICRFCGLKERE